MAQIAMFAFPSGITMHNEQPEIPKSFSFILTNADGRRTYTTVLTFDEAIPPHVKVPAHLKLKWA
jgi:hypothetical protein